MKANLKELHMEIEKQFEGFVGLSFQEVAYKVGLNPDFLTTKSAAVTLVNKMLEYLGVNKNHINKSIQPLELAIKTVRLEANGKPKESMSLEAVKFMDLAEETWQDSFLKRKFSETIFLFIVFQYQRTNTDSPILFFKGVKVWKMPESDLNIDVKTMWEKTKGIVSKGVDLQEVPRGKGKIIKNNLPGMNDNLILHIRPKAKDSNDKVELPCGKFITKQAYWINGKYIAEVLTDLPELERIRRETELEKSEYAYQKQEFSIESLTKPAYTVDEFISIINEKNLRYTELDIKAESLAELKYKIDSRFIVSEEFRSIDEYIEDVIFKSRYFQVPDSPVFGTAYVKRKIENYENAFELLKVESQLYLVTRDFEENVLDRESLWAYMEAVASFAGTNKFFTLMSLRESGFTHELEEYGFDDVFYESLLKRPGRLKYIKIANKPLFVRMKSDITIHNFIAFILGDEKSLSIDNFIERVNSYFKIKMEYKYALQLMEKSSYFFSKELKKLFVDVKFYYEEIYG